MGKRTRRWWEGAYLGYLEEASEVFVLVCEERRLLPPCDIVLVEDFVPCYPLPPLSPYSLVYGELGHHPAVGVHALQLGNEEVEVFQGLVVLAGEKAVEGLLHGEVFDGLELLLGIPHLEDGAELGDLRPDVTGGRGGVLGGLHAGCSVTVRVVDLGLADGLVEGGYSHSRMKF